MTDIVNEDAGAMPGTAPNAMPGPVSGGPVSGAGGKAGRRTLTIARSALLLAAALVVCLAAMLAVGLQLMRGMDAVADGWRDYDLQAATKSDALSELRGHLGLGGVIDRYREGVQNGGADHAALDRALSLSRANLEIYRDIVTPGEDEAKAITAIAAFLDAIQVQMQDPAAAIPADAFDACRRDAVKGLAALNSHLSAQRARLTAATLDDIEALQRLMAVGGGMIAVLVLGLAGAAVWFTRSRIVGPLGRLVEDARRLARRDLDRPFQGWSKGRGAGASFAGFRQDELGLLGRSLEDSRVALRGLFAAIEEKSRRLGESERRYAMAAAATNDGLWDWDLDSGELYLSPRLRQMLHLPADGGEPGLAALLAHIHSDDRHAVLSAIRQGERSVDGASFDVEFRVLPPDRMREEHVGWVHLHGIVAADPGGRVARLAGSAADISDRKSYEARLVHQATHDFLTGLPNRAFLVRWLHDRQAVSDGGQGDLALLFLDLDGFKVVNDSLGHAVGDRILIATAERVAAALEPGEFVARLGGDEFVVVVPAGREVAIARARALESAFQRPLGAGGTELRVGLSIGLAVDDGTSDDPEGLLRDADIALYRAKEHGKGRTVLFDASLREAILIRSRLQRDLTPSLEAGDIFLVYQPIVALSDGRLTGFEALVRWRHPDLGLVSPAQFIPIAEETGQILPLGRHVLERAVAQLARWRGMAGGGALTVNVNLSARQMWDERYVDDMLDFLADGRADGLKIEVTESMTVTDHDQARAILERFHALGIALCMDDFGTGYSSLSHLSRLPFDVMKIDKSFISALGSDPRQESLLRGIVDLAHRIGLEVVAEGIETEEERAVVTRIGCDYAQGYLFARPLSVADAEALLTAA
ncbi:GGDEF domain-containing protein (plasmid) [Azospirillum sp. B510]|uniref:putative bifunctional diguanylate cyclase/phosphodiesterase n=1 Tax=Azospirillum sp. (strain B510) TaxID=137722 RepID=UPI0001C4B800|nr:EAL domain-containing protein [Azospirillum sp. B510]BAI74585.1 GGDEF domain-containing protein [Azospirillum sp. B510]